MSKRGNLDNIVTFEHICDTVADMRNINAAYATIGSVCLVLSGAGNMLEIYMADSNHQWKLISIGGGSGGGSTTANVKICGDGEYDTQTYTPTTNTPEQGIYYLVPKNGGYSQWEWDGSKWEETFNTFDGGTIDWLNTDMQDAWSIKNKPFIWQGTGDLANRENQAHSAVGVSSHAEGINTDAIG